MKKLILIISSLFMFSLVYAKPYNWVVSQVGKYSITKYDLDQAVRFEEIIGQKKVSREEVLKQLWMTYSIFMLSAEDENYRVPESDVEKTFEAQTNAENSLSADVVREQQKIYKQFADLFKLQIKRNRMMQTLFFYNEDLKQKASADPTEQEMKDFYEKNSKYFMSTPKVDVIIFAVKKNKDWSFDYLEKVESSMKEIAKKLKKSNDFEKIQKQYSFLKLEDFSGRTGLKGIQELNSKAYPQELILLPLQKSMTVPEMVSVKGVPSYRQVQKKVGPGFVFSAPVPMPLKGKKGLYYVVLKVVDRVEPKPIPFEEAKSKIAFILKNKRAEAVLEEKIKEKIRKKEIYISVLDKSYKGVFDEFIRR